MGMRYVDRSVGSQLLPKWLGTYELELHGVMGTLQSLSFRHPIIVGAAEGYYAVGLARWPCVERVTAFEAVVEAHGILGRLAEVNEVSHKLRVLGLCDCSLLKAAIAASEDRHPLLIVDIEGGESILLDPGVVPELSRAVMLVEMHDRFVPGLAERMHARFSPSHRITRIDASERSLDDLPKVLLPLPPLLTTAALHAMHEGRYPGMYWLLIEPRDMPGFPARSA